jgi:hypothetical protein
MDAPQPALAKDEPVFGCNGTSDRVAVNLWRIEPASGGARGDNHPTDASI